MAGLLASKQAQMPMEQSIAKQKDYGALLTQGPDALFVQLLQQQDEEKAAQQAALEEQLLKRQAAAAGNIDLSPAAQLIDSSFGTNISPVFLADQKKQLADQSDLADLEMELAKGVGQSGNGLELAAKYAAQKTSARSAPAKLTVGQESADRDFGKEYSAWNAQGGYAGVEKQLGQLEGVVEKLKAKPSLSGGLSSALPESVRRRTNPESVAMEQAVRQAVMGSLRATLGAQFTEKEGERVMQTSYDPALPATANIAKLESTITDLRTRAAEKEDASKYFEQNEGSLAGYKAASTRVKEPQASKMSDEDAAALSWANSNPKDPRAAAIKKRLGM